MEVDRVDVRGHAILFASGIWARLPDDMPETLVLAALDVCGAPALVARHARPGMRIAVLGAGKSGALCLAQARKSTGGKGQLLALDISEKALAALAELGVCDVSLRVDATRAVEVLEAVRKATGRRALRPGHQLRLGARARRWRPSSPPGTAARPSSSRWPRRFTAAALGAEGVGKDVTMLDRQRLRAGARRSHARPAAQRRAGSASSSQRVTCSSRRTRAVRGWHRAHGP